MAKRTKKDLTNALANCFPYLMHEAKSGLTPTGKKMARQAAGSIVWALGLDEYEGIKACKPIVGGYDDFIDGKATRLLNDDKVET